MDRKTGLQKTFDTVAQGYDHPALSFFPETAKRMVEYLELDQSTPRHLLDVCSGTGVVALEAARHASNTQVTGIDLSAGMLGQAQSKADKHHLDNLHFMQMDLDKLAFQNDEFDYATCSFGLFFLDDMQQGLRNIGSMVKPGGKIAISTFTEGAFEPMSIRFVERYQALGYEAPPLSWKKMTTDEQLIALFSAAEITDVEIYREPLGFHMHSADDWWDVVWNAGYRSMLLAMSEAEQAEFKQHHMNEIQQLCDQGQTWLDTGVAIAVGRLSP